LEDVAKLLYKVNKHSLMLQCHHKETEGVVNKNMRMGIGVTGYLQASEEQRGWLGGVYDTLREFDKEYSKAKGINHSIKLTTVKPSGTLSLLPGVTPGAHPAFSRYLIRRIRVAANSHLVDVVTDHGYPVEFVKRFDGTLDYSTVVAEFPMQFPEGTRLARDMSAIDQLEVVKRLQSEWSDNAVSCTIYYKLEELPAIREYLKHNYNKHFKSISFLLHSDHGFIQAPLEEITEEEYNKRMSKVRPIKSVSNASFEADVECEGGMCPIK